LNTGSVVNGRKTLRDISGPLGKRGNGTVRAACARRREMGVKKNREKRKGTNLNRLRDDCETVKISGKCVGPPQGGGKKEVGEKRIGLEKFKREKGGRGTSLRHATGRELQARIFGGRNHRDATSTTVLLERTNSLTPFRLRKMDAG